MDEADTLTDGQRRTAAARMARRRQGEERAARMLRDRGWLAVPPETRVAVEDAVVNRGLPLAVVGAGRG